MLGILLGEADVQTHEIVGYSALILSAITMIGGVATLIVNARSKNRELEIASNEKIAMNAATMANEKEKSELKLQIAVLGVKTDKCEKDHSDTHRKLAKCEQDHMDGTLDRSKIWAEVKAAKDTAEKAALLANGLTAKLAQTSLAQGTAEGTAIGLAAGVTQGIAEGTATEKAKHPPEVK